MRHKTRVVYTIPCRYGTDFLRLSDTIYPVIAVFSRSDCRAAGVEKNPSYYDFVTSLRVSLLLFFVRLWALRDNKEVFKGE